MTPQYSVSVIIPVLNEEKHLGELLTAINKKQAGNVKEIIVADGGSTDGTIAIAKKAGIKIVHCRKKGRAYQMNRGAAQACGDVLFFLHVDTIPPPGFDSVIIRKIINGAVAGCFRLRFDDDSRILDIYSWFTKLRTTFVRFGDQGLFVGKKIFNESGGFDESLVVMEDQNMVRRLKKAGIFSLADQAVITSARKYRENGYIRLQVIFTVIFLLYYLGVKQEVLVHFYRSFIRS